MLTIKPGDCRDVLRAMPDQSVHCCVTSPPYFGLRDYGHTGQIGLEPTPDVYVAELVAVFAEVRRVLRDDGTLWLNLGDSYNSSSQFNHGRSGGKQAYTEAGEIGWPGHRKKVDGLKPKDLIGIPWRVAFALQADGWYLRQDIIWSKPNPMPESVTDRCTKAHEYIFLMSKSPSYFYDAEAVAEPITSDRAPSRKAKASGAGHLALRPNGTPYDGTGEERNRRSVWTVATQPYSEAHFATFPPDLIEPCIKAGCPKGGTVLDPFGGAGTTGLVADRLGRNAILIELNPEYAAMTERRIRNDAGMFTDVEVSP
jgi:DNA modification methylase